MKHMNLRMYEANPDSLGGEGNDGGDEAVEAVDAPAAETNWRTEMSGGDEALGKRLERFANPAAAGKALAEAQNKVREGNLAKPLAADATPEDVAAYREAHGIPKDAREYIDNLPDGLVIGEDDMPMVENLAEFMHDRNAKPEDVHALLGWYNETQEQIALETQNEDLQSTQNADDHFREEWGQDYRANVNILNTFIESELGDAAQDLLGGRDAHGHALFNNPAVVSMMLKVARESSPMSAIVGSVHDAPGRGEARKVEIEALMGNKNSAYWKGDQADKMQAELRNIYDAEAAQKARGR